MEIKNSSRSNSCLHLRTADGIQFIRFDDIIRVEADNKKIKVFVKYANDPLLGIGKMSDIENQLTLSVFFRCHRSHIVNLQYIEKYVPKGRGCQLVTLRGAIPLAESKVNLFKNYIIPNI